jgi:hypothetical protein
MYEESIEVAKSFTSSLTEIGAVDEFLKKNFIYHAV